MMSAVSDPMAWAGGVSQGNHACAISARRLHRLSLTWRVLVCRNFHHESDDFQDGTRNRTASVWLVPLGYVLGYV
jgi:hypothetical protein